MKFNHNTKHLNGTAQFMANKQINEAKKEHEHSKKNLAIEEYNEKVEQLHELVKWFEKEHKTNKIISENITKLKDAAVFIQPLPNKK